MPPTIDSVNDYLATLADDRRNVIQQVRDVLCQNLPEGYEEGIQYGMIGYYVPHSIYPGGYHCDPRQPLPFASLASQKHHLSLYLYFIYASREQEQWWRTAWQATGKRLDMGKSCIRFKRIDDLPLEVIGEAVRRVPVAQFIAAYEAATVKKKKSR